MRNINDIHSVVREFQAFLTMERGLAANTAESYTFDITKLLAYLDSLGRKLRETDYDTLQGFAASLFDLGIAESSRKRVIAGIKTFFHFLKISGYLDDDPSVLLETPAVGERLPQVLSLEEIDAMAAAIDPESPHGIRNRAILETLYGCGLRVSELVNLEFSQLMLPEQFLIASGKGGKERMVPMSEVSIDWIKAYAEGPRAQITPRRGEENIVFLSARGGRLTRQMVFIIVKKLAQAAGITKAISPHTLRHSFATHLLEGGANLLAIQQMLGHESIGTTEIYLNIDTSHLREEICLHHPRNITTHSNK